MNPGFVFFFPNVDVPDRNYNEVGNHSGWGRKAKITGILSFSVYRLGHLNSVKECKVNFWSSSPVDNSRFHFITSTGW